MPKRQRRGLTRRIIMAMTLALAGLGPAGADVVDFAQGNQIAAEVYAKAKEKYVAQVDPLILAVNGDIILQHNGVRRSFNFVPAAYDVLKAVGHVPRSVWAALRPAIDGLDPKEDWRGSLQALRRSAERELVNVAAAPLTEDAKRRDTAILRGSIDIMDAALARGLPTLAELRQSLRKLGPLLLADAADAANEQIAAIDREVRPWWEALSEAQQAAAVVVVNGPKTAREDNLIFKYFTNLLGEGSAGQRVLYAEGAWDVDAVLKMLASVTTDRRLSEDFFRQKHRMERDLLGDAAEARLLELFGRLGRK